MATKTQWFPTKTGTLTGNLAALNAPKTTTKSTPYFVPSPTGLPVTQSQVQFLSGSKGSSSTPYYPTPTTAPIPQSPRTVSAGSKSSGSSVLGATTSYTPQVSYSMTPSTLGASSLGSSSYSYTSPSVTLPSSPGTISANFDISSVLTPGMIADGYSFDQETGRILTPQQAAEGKGQEVSTFDKYMAKFKEVLPKPEKKADALKQLEEQAQLKQKQDTVNSLTQQLNAVTSKQQADLLNLRGIGVKEGVTETVYGGQQLEINREAAIKSLPIAAQLSAAQNDLDTAQSYVDRYFKIYSDDVDNEYKYQTDLINSVFNYADKEDQRKLAELKDQKDNEFTLKRDAIQDARQLANTALANGQQSLFSQLMTLTQNPDDPQFVQKVAQLGGQVQVKASTSTGFNQDYANAQQFVKDNPNATPQELEQGIRANAKSLSESEIQSLIGTKSKLTRASISSLFGIPDTNDNVGGFLGIGGTTGTAKLDGIMATIKKYQDVGYSDSDIMKMMQE